MNAFSLMSIKRGPTQMGRRPVKRTGRLMLAGGGTKPSGRSTGVIRKVATRRTTGTSRSMARRGILD